MTKAIPDVENPISFTKSIISNSPFVRVIDGEIFDVKMQYPLLNLQNAVSECYVREEVFERLKLAQSLLPPDYRLRIWDAWRPFALQEELYQKYSRYIIKRFNLTDASPDQKKKTIEKYISFPQKNKRLSAVHTTGGAVDVTLTDKNGNELQMGTDFDAFCNETKTNYYEADNQNTAIRDNRRILYNCMTRAGFTNLPSEWWHYDFGDKFWSYYNKTPALYSGVFNKNELTAE